MAKKALGKWGFPKKIIQVRAQSSKCGPESQFSPFLSLFLDTLINLNDNIFLGIYGIVMYLGGT